MCIIIGNVYAADTFARAIDITAHHYQATDILEIEFNDIGVFADVMWAGYMLNPAWYVI